MWYIEAACRKAEELADLVEDGKLTEDEAWQAWLDWEAEHSPHAVHLQSCRRKASEHNG